MKAAVENAGNAYLKKRTAWVQLCQEMGHLRTQQSVAEGEMHAAAKGIRDAIEESMEPPADTLWLPFGRTLIEVKKGYTSEDGIYTHRLED